ncbi:S-adenosyl-L-methionine-dependent methyltransferase [Colletotrichum zoysiae]|uniref:S-adenosyl-L-methionine-dependent methyltransferase n=1 Tax=Colletotrichum zoysiae TaxID=1216348 RepID=A0AAD9LVE1_9PEZI|nr:S-adenosyl-L-methionine-dependent methyltransferase [Colletotrichum zoysiae]
MPTGPVNQSLDLQSKLFQRFLGSQYFREVVHSRKGEQTRVLDVGTGTGEWAIGYADTYSDQVHVIGVDIRVMQPDWVPHNCFFEIYNCEQQWPWNDGFDYIRICGTAGCFKDVQRLVKQAFEKLQPGGILQMVDFDLRLRRHDGEDTRDDDALKLFRRHAEAANNLERPIDVAPRYHRMMQEAGFELVRNDVFKVPANPWPVDEQEKKVGYMMQECITSDLEGMVTDRLVSGLGFVSEEVIVDCVTARKHLRNTENQFCFDL